jgi:hypothetical protein
MTNLQNLTVEQLRKVVAIKEEIERLEAQLAKVSGAKTPGRRGRPPGSAAVPVVRRRRKMSAAAKARIAAAQRARWAKVKGRKGSKAAPAKKVKKKRKVNAATRARLAAIARARWAKVKASGKSTL